MKTALRVAVVSASLIAASGIAIGTIEVPGIEVLAIALAHAAAFASSALGTSVSLDGAVIEADGFLAVVAAQCTGIELILIFGAAVLVCPVSLRARLCALLLGIPALFALNLVRVVSLLFVGVSFPEHFDTAHLVVWQTVMVAATLAMWLIWYRQSWRKQSWRRQASVESAAANRRLAGD